jgi:hypothetical protein
MTQKIRKGKEIFTKDEQKQYLIFEREKEHVIQKRLTFMPAVGNVCHF